MSQIQKLNTVLAHIKSTFVGKDEVIDLLGISLVAKENMFILGPPGTAKSAIVRLLANCIEGGNNFEYLLTRFTEPNEIFGPFDIRKLKEGDLVTNTDGMMPEANMVFLDEIFNANSAILNSLLMALNERIFRRGKQTIQLPALLFVGASNIVPEDEALNALLDRFLVRVRSEYVNPDLLQEVLIAGRKLEQNTPTDSPTIHPNDIIALQNDCKKIDLSSIHESYINIIQNLRNTGIKISDRRAVKIQNLIAASALISGRTQVELSDLWVLRYIWDMEDQIEILAGIINNIIEENKSQTAHNQAYNHVIPDPEDLLKDIEELTQKWHSELPATEQNVIKDKLRYLQSRTDWVTNSTQKEYIQEKIKTIWLQILQMAE